MLTITEAASARLAGILDQRNLPEEVAVRFVHEEGQIQLRSDNEHPGDTTFQHEGRTVLLLDAHVSELLTNEMLDVEGQGLTFRATDDGQ